MDVVTLVGMVFSMKQKRGVCTEAAGNSMTGTEGKVLR